MTSNDEDSSASRTISHNTDYRDDTDSGSIPTLHIREPPANERGVILLSLGSFNPPTVSHVRLLISAYDSIRRDSFISGAYLSPVGDAYASSKPSGLIPASHRVKMCRLATSNIQWVDVMTWEAHRKEYARSHMVVKQLLKKLNGNYDVVLVCGEDLRQAMKIPSKWPVQSVNELKSVVKAFAVKKRSGVFVESTGGLEKVDEEGKAKDDQKDIDIEPWVGDLSSTAVRNHIKKGWSVHMMIHPDVEDYIHQNSLYKSK